MGCKYLMKSVCNCMITVLNFPLQQDFVFPYSSKIIFSINTIIYYINKIEHRKIKIIVTKIKCAMNEVSVISVSIENNFYILIISIS